MRREHDDVVDRLRAATAIVAEAQEAVITTGDRDALRDATTRRREALRAVGHAVEQVLARNGRPAHHRDEVLAALEASVTDEVAGGTFGLPDDLELPDPEPERDLEAERVAAEVKAAADAEIAEAEAGVRAAKDTLDEARSELAAVVERHRRVEGDA